jgi:hypothetical protein
MAYTKYSLTPADNNAAPPNGAPEGMLPSAVNDTMRDMMSQIRDVGDGIRGGTYTMTAPVITGGSITGVALSGNTLTNPVITGGSINNTPIGATTANTGAFTTLGATGVATFSAGTVSAPAITTTGDTNTGIFFPAADTIAFTEGGAESMRIDSSGNVGIGTSSPTGKLDVVSGSSLVGRFYNNAGRGQVAVDGTSDSSFVMRRNGTQIGWIQTDSSGTEINTGTTAAHPYCFYTNNTERMRIDSSGRLGIGTSSPSALLTVNGAAWTAPGAPWQGTILAYNTNALGTDVGAGLLLGGVYQSGLTTEFAQIVGAKENATSGNYAGNMIFYTRPNGTTLTERMRIDSSGNLIVGKTSATFSSAGTYLNSTGSGYFTASASDLISVNRLTNDGALVAFYQDNALEGTISVSGTTVSYNGGHLSRWSQWQNQTGKPEVYRGSVLESTNDMCEWNQANEQATKTIVSSTVKSKAVAGVFDMYDIDDEDSPYDFYVAQSGDFVIRIAQGVVVENGDLLESAGDGTARPQTDDICRSSTIAKVTSNYVSTTYADGSYCVPCILMIG